LEAASLHAVVFRVRALSSRADSEDFDQEVYRMVLFFESFYLRLSERHANDWNCQLSSRLNESILNEILVKSRLFEVYKLSL